MTAAIARYTLNILVYFLICAKEKIYIVAILYNVDLIKNEYRLYY